MFFFYTFTNYCTSSRKLDFCFYGICACGAVSGMCRRKDKARSCNVGSPWQSRVLIIHGCGMWANFDYATVSKSELGELALFTSRISHTEHRCAKRF